MVGLLEDALYEQGPVQLHPGDVLIFFTDGISEAMNLDDEEWGEERLLETVQGHRHASAQELLDCLFDAATQYAGAAAQHDDHDLGRRPRVRCRAQLIYVTSRSPKYITRRHSVCYRLSKLFTKTQHCPVR